MAALSSSLSSVRSWRTAFLTLRDETLNSPPCTALIRLLNHLIFSHSETLIPVAPGLPSHEVTSDMMFLLELARTATDSASDDDTTHTFAQLSHLIYNVSHRVSLDINSSYWTLMLESFGRMVERVLGQDGRKRVSLGNVVARAVKQCLETLRCLVSVYQRKYSLSENTELLNFLLSIVTYTHAELFCSFSSSGNPLYTAELGKRVPRCNSLWEVQTAAFTMISEVFSRVGSSLSVDIWQSTIQVLKKVMDGLASKHFLVEDIVMARFYTSLLHCLHLVLVDPKGPLSDHVAGFVAALRMFFIYGITNRSQLVYPLASNKKEISSTSLKSNLGGSRKSESGPYRPPHLRKQDLTNMQQLKSQESPSFSDEESSKFDYMSSDSDYSDNDGPAKDADNIHCSKARVAAIVCIQDLCRADPKLFTAQWTMLLPSSDVLHPRKYEATLMTCLLFDPSLKARIASASTLVAMLDGPASVFLQVAEYKESTKCGSFTALSSSLGQILMQLNTGVLYLIQHETHSGLLASLFKILMLLISSTPYSRMPGHLLPSVISSLRARIEEGFSFRSDQTNLLLPPCAASATVFATHPHHTSRLPPQLHYLQLLCNFHCRRTFPLKPYHCPSPFSTPPLDHHQSLTSAALEAMAVAGLGWGGKGEDGVGRWLRGWGWIGGMFEGWGRWRKMVFRAEAVAFNCLTVALSASPSSPTVKDLFGAELCRGFDVAQESSGVLSTIFRFSEPINSPTISLEALQALRAVSHNYPEIIVVCWAQVSSTIHGFLRLASPEVPARSWKGNVGNVLPIGEKVITAAIKVLDECLRAISGFSGTEDLFNDKLFDTPFTSEYCRTKKISSAPSYGSENLAVTKDEPEARRSGSEQWSEAIEKHMPLILSHTSAMVRAASITCFAGITSSAFSSLPKEKQDFVLTSSINAALNDEVPSVRSAACRAIGVIACFPQISQSAEILGKFIRAAEINTHDSLVLVRITASWAMANICDSLRHHINVTSKRCSVDSKVTSQLIALLIECALRLTKDGDKIKANAVRALGNLSRFVQFRSQSSVLYERADGIGLSLTFNGAEKLLARDLEDSHKDQSALNSFQAACLEDSRWLGRMVQAFLSCVATGNVKVQWNVCHALSNLFLNETLKLGDMDWQNLEDDELSNDLIIITKSTKWASKSPMVTPNLQQC
ncbi:ARM repeat superfamily protein [Actinidia rufa]|uniref:ARM repeat superfamily protein n=1 Tax=Actinidia rufa TaxID=165716 RepID=A0A7J0DX79_9ERIC|nr:ARM repeat superfamily protein [Actinidia rufa]